MSVEIIFTKKDKEVVEENHTETVAEALEKKVKTKNETLQWKSSFSECYSRFYNIIGSKGEYFPEVNFRPNRQDYRAVFVWIPSRKEIRFIKAVRKSDKYTTSSQWKILKQIETHPQKVLEEIKQNVETTCNTKETC